MGKVNIIFWSRTGNTAAMADFIAQGVTIAGGEPVLMHAGDVDVEVLKNTKAFAIGCPAMGKEQLEKSVVEPLMCRLESTIAGKQVVLFGSYGHGDQTWMRNWEKRITDAGAIVVNGQGITANYAPDEQIEEQCKSAGRILAGAE